MVNKELIFNKHTKILDLHIQKGMLHVVAVVNYIVQTFRYYVYDLLDMLFYMFFCRPLIFSKITFLKKKSFKNNVRISNKLDPDHSRIQRVKGDPDPLLGKSQVIWVSIEISIGTPL